MGPRAGARLFLRDLPSKMSTIYISMDDYKKRIADAINSFQAKQDKPKSTKRNAKPEKIVEIACLVLMRQMNWSVEIYEAKATFDPRRGVYRQQAMKAGTVDCMGSTDEGISVAVEFKAEGKLSALSEDQKAFLEKKINSNAFACVVDSGDRLLIIYSEWKKARTNNQAKAREYLLSMLPKKKVTKLFDT